MNINNLDLNLLIVFDAVYTVRNISKAAEILDLSQPTVSHALARLRKQLDDQLFVRSGNGVSPTARASAIAGPIKIAIESLKYGLARDNTFDPEKSDRRFKIMTADPMEPIILPPLIRKIQHAGNVTLELTNLATSPIELALMDGTVDIVVFLQPTREEELVWEPLCPVDLVIIARKGHPVENELNDPSFLGRYGHVTINLRPGASPNSNKIQLWQRIQRRDVCVVNRMSSIPNIVANSDLLAIVPHFYAKEMADRFDLQIIKPKSKLGDQQMFMIWHKRNEQDSAHQWLREQIKEAVREVTAATAD